VSLRDPPQLVVDERQQFVDGAIVAAAPLNQQRCDVVRSSLGQSASASTGNTTLILRRPAMTAALTELRLPPRHAAAAREEGRRDDAFFGRFFHVPGEP
jgi:hypothetical protein